MDTLPALELLEATHQFPCPYTFKVIGKSEDGFPERVVLAVKTELPDDVDVPHSIRQTPAGRHTSVTLEPHMESAHHVLAVYKRIMDVDGLVLVW